MLIKENKDFVNKLYLHSTMEFTLQKSVNINSEESHAFLCIPIPDTCSLYLEKYGQFSYDYRASTCTVTT